MNMTTHTRVTIGTKPAAAIIAEFKATLPEFEPQPPAGSGWVEACELRSALGLTESKFKRLVLNRTHAGAWERDTGTKLNKNGKLCGAFYYRVKPCKPARKAG